MHLGQVRRLRIIAKEMGWRVIWRGDWIRCYRDRATTPNGEPHTVGVRYKAFAHEGAEDEQRALDRVIQNIMTNYGKQKATEFCASVTNLGPGVEF